MMFEFWKAFVGGVTHEQETSGVCDGLADDDIFCSVRPDGSDRGADTMKPERYGITRHADSQNVLEVDFLHFRTVRDVRASVYGERRSPLASDLRVK
jgi:hypothetical protein